MVSPLALRPITSSHLPAPRAVRYMKRRQLVEALPAASQYARGSVNTGEQAQAFAILNALIREHYWRGIVVQRTW